MTGPGEVERDKNGDGVLEEKASFAPSTKRGMAGEGGLLVADEVLLPVLLFEASSETPSFCVVLAEAEGVTGGEVLPEGVPNWVRISARLGQATWVWLRTYKAKLLDQLVILR